MSVDEPIHIGTHRKCGGGVFMWQRELLKSSTLCCQRCGEERLRGDVEVDWLPQALEKVIEEI